MYFPIAIFAVYWELQQYCSIVYQYNKTILFVLTKLLLAEQRLEFV